MKKISNTKNFVSGMEDLIPAVNDTPYNRVIAIGDVHGMYKRLISLWEKLNVTARDKIIFLGDYIDRGEDVADVLQWIIKQSKRKNFVFLRGNHEQYLIDLFQSRIDKITWLFNGGYSTIRGLSKLKSEDATSINKVLNFVENLPLYHSMIIGGREFVFVHGGIDSSLPLDKQKADFMLWAREEFFNHYDGEAMVISGHSPVQAFPEFGVSDNPRPVKLPGKNILLTDTGSFVHNGKISAVDILSGRYWTSD